MHTPHVGTRDTLASRRVRQIVAAVLAIAGAALTATVVARPAPAALRSSVQELPTFTVPESLEDHIASSGEDTGPGCAESEVAKLPEENR